MMAGSGMKPYHVMQNTDATPAPDPGSGDSLDGHTIPIDYRPQIEKALAHDRERASNYFKHTLIGDPVADEMLEECSSLERAELYLFIQAGMDEDKAALADAPAALREFFKGMDSLPDWFNDVPEMPGVRAFHRNSALVVGAMVGGVLVEGFTTNISRSFFLSGRLRDQGVRRLQQNNRHMLEIFMPGGLDRQGDGFKLSVRIRLVHAQIRRLLSRSEDWDMGSLGHAHQRCAHGLRHLRLLGPPAAPRQESGRCVQRRGTRELHADMAALGLSDGDPRDHPFPQ